MTPAPDNHDKLERHVHRVLRELPPRPAPRTLEQRVRAEIERRLALPWWRQSFGHWPAAARAGFIVLCIAIARLAFTAGGWMLAAFDPAELQQAVAQPFSWMERALVVVHALAGFFEIMLRNIPSVWLYPGLVVFGAMYAALFGLGAAALKTIRAQR